MLYRNPQLREKPDGIGLVSRYAGYGRVGEVLERLEEGTGESAVEQQVRLCPQDPCRRAVRDDFLIKALKLPPQALHITHGADDSKRRQVGVCTIKRPGKEIRHATARYLCSPVVPRKKRIEMMVVKR